MPWIVIPIAWLLIVAVIVAVCRAAADGDAFASSTRETTDAPIGERLLLNEQPAVDGVHASRAHSAPRTPRTAHRAGRRRITAR
jgi:hypothetical protein